MFTFLIVAAVIFFLVVKPLNVLPRGARQASSPEPEAPAEDVRLLAEIRDLLKQRASRRPSTPSRPT